MNNEYAEESGSDGETGVRSRTSPEGRVDGSDPHGGDLHEKQAGPTPSKRDLPEPPKSQDVHTLADLIRYAYGRGGQRVSKAAVSKEVAEHLELDSEMRDELRLWARTDTLLRVPWQLMAAVLREQPGPEFLSRVTDVVAFAVREHPVLVNGSYGESQHASPDEPKSPEWASAVRTILASLELADSRDARTDIDGREVIAAAASLPDSLIESSIGKAGQLSPSEITEFKTNLVNTVAVFFASTHGWSTSVLLDALYDNLWRPLAEAESDPPTLTLTAKPEPAVASHVTEVWMDRTVQAHRQADEARQDADRMSRHATRLQQQIDQLQMETLDLRAEVERLDATRGELEGKLAERERHLGETKAHASHDYETLRTSSIQRARRELELLQEGLHALTRDDPKLHVTRDRVERAIEGLEKELDHLKGGQGT